MKLSEYIERLNKFLQENGDMEVYCAADDEENDYQQVEYQKVEYAGSKLFRYKGSSQYRPDLMNEEDIEEYDYLKEDFIPVCVVN